jgi:signal transduction histidine kinase
MKIRNTILILIFLFISIFVFTIVRLTNWNLERIYRRSFENTFYLLSYISNHYLEHEKELEEIEIENLREISIDIENNISSLNDSYLSESIQGIWVFKESLLKGVTYKKNFEKEVIDFYKQNLKDKDTYTIIFIENKPFYLVNFKLDLLNILMLYETKGISEIRINQLLDSLVVSSDLIYFSILDKEQNPLIFSSFYENFLPLKGEGQYIIETPQGNIFQIEERISDKNFIAGFSMNSLMKIKSFNNIFLIVVLVIFIALEGILLFDFLKFERFKIEKEKEVNLLREIGALSTGFAHEFRNSLNTLSLLSKGLSEVNKDILKEEIDRMKKVMDSLRLIGTTEIEKGGIVLSELINESISLLKSILNNVNIEKEIDESLKIYGNRTLLLSAFSNLIQNSIEAKAKNIIIKATQKGKKTSIDIIDDGAGIEIEYINEIFNPFFSNKSQSGLGLYLVKKIVEVHNGSIEAIKNKKTVFRIVLN